MEWSGCMSLLQGYLENSPLIVLGSGASMPYELPSMGGLAEETKKSTAPKTGDNTPILFWILLAGAGMAGLGGTVILRKKKK